MNIDFYTEYKDLIYGKNKFFVKIKAGAKKTEIKGVIQISDKHIVTKSLYISLKEEAIQGKANKALLKFLNKLFGLKFFIKSGQNSKLKVLEIVK